MVRKKYIYFYHLYLNILITLEKVYLKTHFHLYIQLILKIRDIFQLLLRQYGKYGLDKCIFWDLGSNVFLFPNYLHIKLKVQQDLDYFLITGQPFLYFVHIF